MYKSMCGGHRFFSIQPGSSWMVDASISHRRQGGRAAAGHLYDRLSTHFGDGRVSMDVDDRELGAIKRVSAAAEREDL